ncbi:MAG: hypothetical protein FWF77_03765 [Defluviitaleaceae bacterium]|nr:hypothetical protein [Defluviitaleaceae bacterium]
MNGAFHIKKLHLEIAMIIGITFTTFVMFPLLSFALRLNFPGNNTIYPGVSALWTDIILTILFIKMWIMMSALALTLKLKKFFFAYFYWIFLTLAISFIEILMWTWMFFDRINLYQFNSVFTEVFVQIFISPTFGIPTLIMMLEMRQLSGAASAITIILCMNMLLLGAGLYALACWLKNRDQKKEQAHE